VCLSSWRYLNENRRIYFIRVRRSVSRQARCRDAGKRRSGRFINLSTGTSNSFLATVRWHIHHPLSATRVRKLRAGEIMIKGRESWRYGCMHMNSYSLIDQNYLVSPVSSAHRCNALTGLTPSSWLSRVPPGKSVPSRSHSLIDFVGHTDETHNSRQCFQRVGQTSRTDACSSRTVIGRARSVCAL